MTNMSDKNFPHAHGAGRVVAAFDLSHPGSTEGSNPGAFADGADDLAVRPPRFFDPALETQYPYPPPPFSGPPAEFAFDATRQPYNATSLGVYVTGSGTRRLPYRDALGLEVPQALSPALHDIFPSNDLYDFSAVDDSKLGSTHAQVVCQVNSLPGGDALGEAAYYEIGLNWDLPPLKYQMDLSAGPSIGISLSNLGNQAQASYQRALERTFWVTGSIGANALSEAHPAVEFPGLTPQEVNWGFGPQAGMVAGPPSFTGYSAPYYQDIFNVPDVLPNTFPNPGDEDWQQNPAIIQCALSAIPYQFRATQPASPPGLPLLNVEIRCAAIVRVFCLQKVNPPGEVQFDPIGPRPLPRQGVNPYFGDNPLLPPSINVSVLQKNTAAIDGTDGPIYDLFSEWGSLGSESVVDPPARATRSAPALTLDEIKRRFDRGNQ